MEKYTGLTQELKKIIAKIDPDFDFPAGTWTMEKKEVTDGPYGETEENWTMSSGSSFLHAVVSAAIDEDGSLEDEQIIMWPDALQGDAALNLQSAPDFFNEETNHITLNITAPGSHLAKGLSCATSGKKPFPFFREVTQKAFPGFRVPEENWQEVERDPGDVPLSIEGSTVHVMGSEEAGFRKTIETVSEERGHGQATRETLILTASGLPEEAEITLHTPVTGENKYGKFSLYIMAPERLFTEVIGRLFP